MNSWEALKALRVKKQSLELSSSTLLSDKTYAIYCLVEHMPRINITGIRKHPYFGDMSFSTVKRLVGKLINSGLVIKQVSTDDKREVELCVKETV